MKKSELTSLIAEVLIKEDTAVGNTPQQLIQKAIDDVKDLDWLLSRLSNLSADKRESIKKLRTQLDKIEKELLLM